MFTGCEDGAARTYAKRRVRRRRGPAFKARHSASARLSGLLARLMARISAMMRRDTAFMGGFLFARPRALLTGAPRPRTTWGSRAGLRLVADIGHRADREVPERDLDEHQERAEARERPDGREESDEAARQRDRDDYAPHDPAHRLRSHPAAGFDVEPRDEGGEGHGQHTHDERGAGDGSRRDDDGHEERGDEDKIAEDRRPQVWFQDCHLAHLLLRFDARV